MDGENVETAQREGRAEIESSGSRLGHRPLAPKQPPPTIHKKSTAPAVERARGAGSCKRHAARGARRAATRRRVRAQRAAQRAQRAASLARRRPRHPQHTWRFSRGSADGAPSDEHHYPRPPVASALVAVRGVARRRARQSAGSEQRCVAASKCFACSATAGSSESGSLSSCTLARVLSKGTGLHRCYCLGRRHCSAASRYTRNSREVQQRFSR